VSFVDIENNEMRNFLLHYLKNFENSATLTLEILESDSIEDFDLINDFIKKVKKYNVKIAIDDFGSGYSNFSRIIELNPDILKIDGSLIKNIDTDENKQKIVKSIIAFAKGLNIQTVAEYVENEAIFEVCKNMGIDYFQGYYFSPPKRLFKNNSKFHRSMSSVNQKAFNICRFTRT
jgi:EAL domain-containing protein (putative c-di-GMP-specific phosphodiesterase class I)